MSNKRTATTELNHDNWDDEDEPESNTEGFARAAPDELKNRKFKVAKRRVNTPGGAAVNSPFSSFSGFSGGAKAEVPKPNFSFVMGSSGQENGHGAEKPKDPTPKHTPKESPVAQETSDKYLARLKKLNESLSKCIASHVADNPFCILSPVFKDYDKHLASLEKFKSTPSISNESGVAVMSADDEDTPTEIAVSVKETPKEEAKPVQEVSPAPTPVEEPPKIPTLQTSAAASTDSDATSTGSYFSSSQSIFGGLKSSSGSLFGGTTSEGVKPSLTFNFGSSTSTTSALNAPFQFGSGNTTTSTSNFSSSGTGVGFSFAGLAAKAAEQQQAKQAEEAAEENEEPPKVEFNAIEEKGSVYETKCKVYVKKENEYKERGVGMLYIKKVDEKHQLLVRTGSVTGQVLLNVLLGRGQMAQLQGKNNVSLACIPTPDDQPPPVLVLLKVKTPEEAEGLLAKMKECGSQ